MIVPTILSAISPASLQLLSFTFHLSLTETYNLRYVPNYKTRRCLFLIGHPDPEKPKNPLRLGGSIFSFSFNRQSSIINFTPLNFHEVKRRCRFNRGINPIPARQGLVCSDPLSFFQDHNKPTNNPLCALSAFVVQKQKPCHPRNPCQKRSEGNNVPYYTHNFNTRPFDSRPSGLGSVLILYLSSRIITNQQKNLLAFLAPLRFKNKNRVIREIHAKKGQRVTTSPITTALKT